MQLAVKQEAQRRIVCAAVRIDVDKVICSPRHYDSVCRATINLLPEEDREKWYCAEQGFVDQFGKFLDRHEAYKIAKAANQIIFRCGGDEGKLFSENLY